MATSVEQPPAPEQAPPAEPKHFTTGIRIGMRWKLLWAFAGAFTVIFLFVSIWVIRFATNTAEDRLTSQLAETSTGGASTINARQFQRLVDTVEPVPDPSNPTGLGYPDSDLYRAQAEQLMRIRQIVPEANPYSYYRNPADDKLYFVASAGYLLEPQFGVTFMVPVDAIVSPATYARMEQGLVETTSEPAYVDEFGSWISSYSPVTNSDGQTVGAIGVDYPNGYVDQVRKRARDTVIPVVAVSYVILLIVVMLLSSMLVRPLQRLTAATRRVANGEYDLDVRSLGRSWFPDEMYDLGESFAIMASKVGAREKSLTRQVQRLKVEIDTVKKEAAVKEITETDFFADLTRKAAEHRRRMKDDPI